MDYAFFCDRCGGKLAGNEKRLRLLCEQCGSVLSEEEFYRQLDKQRDEDFCEQFIAASRREREEYWRGVRRAGAGRLLIPAPVERAHVPQWSAYMTGILGKYRGTPDEVYFSRLGLDISTNACGERLYERFFESAGDHGNPLIFINTILTTFDHWERITYCDITKVLARMYGEDAGLHANGMINTGQRTVLGKLEDMPTLDLFLESLNFYESGKEFLDRRERTYTTSFKKRSTRYVNVALSISNSLYAKQDKTYQVVYRWFHPAGTLLREQESEWTIISEYDDFVATQRFGWDLPGYWTPGTYRLVILVDGVIFAQRPFTIEV